MKQLKDFRDNIHKCSKCGLCQAVCPLYKVTGNDCTVSRGQFIMLKGLLNSELKMTKKLNRYLDLCLKCGKCTEFCPSGIDAVDIIVSAKYEYFRKSPVEKLKSFLQKYLLFGLAASFLSLFRRNKKSKTFDKKVIYFAGCGGKLLGNRDIVKLMNHIGTEVISPDFNCCGMPFYTRGDLDSFRQYINNYINILKKYNTKEIVTACASCEKTIKSYIKWCESEEEKQFLSGLKIKNIYEYLKENDCKFELKNKVKATYHKPCNQHNYDDVEHLLGNIKNLEYIKADGFDKCCGLNGIFKFREYPTLINIYKEKHNDFIKTGANVVLTSCLGCEAVLTLISGGKYKVKNLISFINKNTISY